MVRQILIPLLTAVLAFSATPAFAKKKKGKKKKQEKTEEVSSSENPQTTKKLGVGVNVAVKGLGLGNPAFGGSGFFELSPKIALFSSFLMGSTDLKNSLQSSAGEDITVDKAGISSMEILAGGRYFFGSSLYASGSTGLRRITTDTAFSAPDASLSMQTTSMSIVLGGGVGNRWYLGKSFYVSGEWLSYQLAPVSNYSFKSSADGFDDETADFIESTTSDLAQKLGKTSVTTLINLSAGMAF